MASLFKGQVYILFMILMETILTMPSEPSDVLIILPTGHSNGLVGNLYEKTTFPIFMQVRERVCPNHQSV